LFLFPTIRNKIFGALKYVFVFQNKKYSRILITTTIIQIDNYNTVMIQVKKL